MLKKILPSYRQSSAASLPSLVQIYQQHVSQQVLQVDSAQLEALAHLQSLLSQLHQDTIYKRQQSKNLYLFGEVGGGKSLLMNLFFQQCRITKKRRIHFNVFMLELHEFLHQWRVKNKQGDALKALAREIQHNTVLLCFDEFHVTDIADAMLLGRLFKLLFEAGVILVMTSNRHPNSLYQGGLQRESFLFFVDFLNKTSTIIQLNAQQDYRLIHQQTENQYYHFPLNAEAERFMQTHYRRLTHNAPLQKTTLTLLGRKLSINHYENIVFASFDELCGQSLSSADYLALTKQFNIVLLKNIPQLNENKRNEAKRFMTLVDILYEHKIKLICSAEVSAPLLYLTGDNCFEFKRTVSRLIEMQSDYYMKQKMLE